MTAPAKKARTPHQRTGLELLLSANDLAGMLGCSLQQLWRRARRGQIPGQVKLGRRVLFSRARVEAWLATGDMAEPMGESECGEGAHG